MKVEFQEKQKFTQWWLWLILITTAAAPFLGLFRQIFLVEKFGDAPKFDSTIVIFSAIMAFVIVLFLIMNLKTEIDEQEIRIKFFPFVTKRIDWKDIKTVKVVNYGFVGGWGIRLFTDYGTVFNTSGNKGLVVELHNGKRLVIGTQKEEELRNFIRKFQV